MQPTILLVLSRLKEYFGIKLSMKDWKAFIDYFIDNKATYQLLNKHKQALNEFSIKKTNGGEGLICFRGTSWPYDDLSKVSSDDEDYLAFLSYVQEYFSSQASLHEQDTRMSETKSKP